LKALAVHSLYIQLHGREKLTIEVWRVEVSRRHGEKERKEGVKTLG